MHDPAHPDLAKPLILSALFILALAAAAAGLSLREPPLPAGTPAPAAPAGMVTLPPGEQGAVAAPTEGAALAVKNQDKLLARRLAYAGEVERRLRSRDLPLVAQVTGESQRVLTFRWTLEPNPDQLRIIGQAEDLYPELKDMGFVQVEMLSLQATRLLWSKDL